MYELRVDGELLDSARFFTGYPDNINDLLLNFGVVCEPYTLDGQNSEITDGWAYDLGRVKFINTTKDNKRIRLRPTDANLPDTNYSPENTSFFFNDSENLSDIATTFCLAPSVEIEDDLTLINSANQTVYRN